MYTAARGFVSLINKLCPLQEKPKLINVTNVAFTKVTEDDKKTIIEFKSYPLTATISVRETELQSTISPTYNNDNSL